MDFINPFVAYYDISEVVGNQQSLRFSYDCLTFKKKIVTQFSIRCHPSFNLNSHDTKHDSLNRVTEDNDKGGL